MESQRGKKMRERFSGQKKGGTKSDTKVSNNGCEGKKKEGRRTKTEHGRLLHGFD